LAIAKSSACSPLIYVDVRPFRRLQQCQRQFACCDLPWEDRTACWDSSIEIQLPAHFKSCSSESAVGVSSTRKQCMEACRLIFDFVRDVNSDSCQHDAVRRRHYRGWIQHVDGRFDSCRFFQPHVRSLTGQQMACMHGGSKRKRCRSTRSKRENGVAAEACSIAAMLDCLLWD
jgi:hypothetical protein